LLSDSEIEGFFSSVVEIWIYNDIANCIRAKANFAVALALMSYTEFLGGLYSGKLGLKNESRSNFNNGMEMRITTKISK
jgi:hypothetical protein